MASGLNQPYRSWTLYRAESSVARDLGSFTCNLGSANISPLRKILSSSHRLDLDGANLVFRYFRHRVQGRNGEPVCPRLREVEIGVDHAGRDAVGDPGLRLDAPPPG